MDFLLEPVNFDDIPADDREILEDITISEIAARDEEGLNDLTNNMDDKYVLYLLKNLVTKEDRMGLINHIDFLTTYGAGCSYDPATKEVYVSPFYAKFMPLVEFDMLDAFLDCGESVDKRMKLLSDLIHKMSEDYYYCSVVRDWYEEECESLVEKKDDLESTLRQYEKIMKRQDKQINHFKSQPGITLEQLEERLAAIDDEGARREAMAKITKFNQEVLGGALEWDEAVEEQKVKVIMTKPATDDEAPVQRSAAPPKAPLRVRVCKAVDRLFDEGLVTRKYYLAAVRWILVERGMFGNLGCPAFVDMLRKGCEVSKDELPSADSITKVMIKGHYPNYKILEKSDADCENMKQVVERFLQLI